MSESSSDETQSTEQGNGSHWWPDETVDAICALIVVTVLTLAVLWYVVNG